jgi:L-lactate dehydrogenase complex protein LldG
LRTGAREHILSSLERHLGVRDNVPDPLEEGKKGDGPVWIPIDAPWDEAKKEIEALSDRFHMAENSGALRRVLADLVAEHDVSRAVRWEHPLLKALGMDKMLSEFGIEVRIASGGEDERDFLAGSQLGITAADALVMESGTLVLSAAKEWGRCISLLPPVHLAVVTADCRLRGIEDLPRLIRQWNAEKKGLPSAVALVTGHSRTADIELTLVSGVHGPGVVHVLGIGSNYDF